MSFSSFLSLSLVFLFILFLGACKFPWSVGYNKGYSPDQPIPFNHAKHAGLYKMDCRFCHTQAERARQASIPSLSVCMKCHLLVKTGSPHIRRLAEAYQKGESIEWVRVHLLPDHAHFNHAAHVQKGVSCQKCHGPVERMEKIYQHSDLSMGWCIGCHREQDPPAPVNCSTCHY